MAPDFSPFQEREFTHAGALDAGVSYVEFTLG